MILEDAARIHVSISAGAEYVLAKKGHPGSTVTVTKTRVMTWDRGAPVAFLHNGRNGDAPLHIPIERIMERRARRDPISLTAPASGHDLMQYLRVWIAALPQSER